MFISAVEALCYGWIAGIASIVLFLLYGVDTLLALTSYVYHFRRPSARWENVTAIPTDRDDRERLPDPYRPGYAAAGGRGSILHEMGYEGVGGCPTRVSPLRHSAECVLSWFEEDIVGSAMDCRLALSDYTVTVYQRFPMQSGDTTCMAAEHIRGRFDIRRVRARELKGPFGREKKSNPSPFAGRVLWIGSDDGLPLMMPHEGDGNDLSSSTSSSPWWNLGLAECGRPACGLPTCDAEYAERSCEFGAMNSAIDLDRLLKAKDRDTVTWKAILVKFANARETERWRCMLLDLDEVNEWRAFVRNMPNQESCNLILSRFLFQSMRGSGMTGALRSAIRKKLEKTSAQTFPRMLEGQILLDNFVIGKRIPWISKVSEPTVSSSGEFGFDFNLHYKGEDEGFGLYFRLNLSFYGLRIPHIFFVLKLAELEATLHVNVAPPPSNKVWIGGHRPPMLRVKMEQGTATGQGILHRILIALPDLTGIVTNLLKLYLFHNMILPNLDDFPLPSVNKSPPNSPVTKLRTFDWRKAAILSRAPVSAHKNTKNNSSRNSNNNTKNREDTNTRSSVPAASTAATRQEGSHLAARSALYSVQPSHMDKLSSSSLTSAAASMTNVYTTPQTIGGGNNYMTGSAVAVAVAAAAADVRRSSLVSTHSGESTFRGSNESEAAGPSALHLRSNVQSGSHAILDSRQNNRTDPLPAGTTAATHPTVMVPLTLFSRAAVASLQQPQHARETSIHVQHAQTYSSLQLNSHGASASPAPARLDESSRATQQANSPAALLAGSSPVSLTTASSCVSLVSEEDNTDRSNTLRDGFAQRTRVRSSSRELHSGQQGGRGSSPIGEARLPRSAATRAALRHNGSVSFVAAAPSVMLSSASHPTTPSSAATHAGSSAHGHSTYSPSSIWSQSFSHSHKQKSYPSLSSYSLHSPVTQDAVFPVLSGYPAGVHDSAARDMTLNERSGANMCKEDGGQSLLSSRHTHIDGTTGVRTSREKDLAKSNKVSLRQMRRVLKQKGENMMALGTLNASGNMEYKRAHP